MTLKSPLKKHSLWDKLNQTNQKLDLHSNTQVQGRFYRTHSWTLNNMGFNAWVHLYVDVFSICSCTVERL